MTMKDALARLKQNANGRPIIEIDLGDPLATLDSIREADLPAEGLKEIVSSLGEVHTNLHLIGHGITLMIARAEAKATLLAKAAQEPSSTPADPIAGAELRHVTEADLAAMTPVSEGN